MTTTVIGHYPIKCPPPKINIIFAWKFEGWKEGEEEWLICGTSNYLFLHKI